VDGCWVSVGSANLDNRSLRLNEECNLNVLDKQFAIDQAKVFQSDKERSRELTLRDWHRRPSWEKILGTSGRLLRSQM